MSDDTVREWTPPRGIGYEQDARIRGFQDGIPHMAWTVRADGSIEYVNRRWKEYTGMTSEEMADWKWAEIIHADDRSDFMDRWTSAMRSGEHFQAELRIRRFDGIYRWHDLKDWPARDEDGTILRWFGTATDTHDQRQLWDKLQLSNSDLDQFASTAAHDLQEPLRMVGSFVTLLQQQYSDQLDERARGYISKALEGSKRMRLLISELLEFSRVDHEQPEVTEVDAADILDKAYENLRSGSNDVALEISHDPLPHVRMARCHLLSLFQNLIGNGLKYHRPQVHPSIHVEAERSQGEWIFSVRDNGIGILAVDREKIFEVFTRLHCRSEFPGTGIGLAICKKIVLLYGGRIWVEPSDDSGSIFKFSIPDSAT